MTKVFFVSRLKDVLDSGGCIWRDEVRVNGAVWHPRVLPYGQVSCVACYCKVLNSLNKYRTKFVTKELGIVAILNVKIDARQGVELSRYFRTLQRK